MKTHVAIIFVIIGLGIVARILLGCSPAELPEVAAASGYEAQQMACVDQYATKVDIDACRAKVKAAWATDAGKDSAK